MEVKFLPGELFEIEIRNGHLSRPNLRLAKPRPEDYSNEAELLYDLSSLNRMVTQGFD